jgi:hypothetical protein
MRLESEDEQQRECMSRPTLSCSLVQHRKIIALMSVSSTAMHYFAQTSIYHFSVIRIEILEVAEKRVTQ